MVSRYGITLQLLRNARKQVGVYCKYYNYSTNTHVRVRYAPSPTGYLHLGGLRTALFNYLFAKRHDGEFILRIEDTDKTRQVKGSIEALINSLHWCGIQEDEGPMQGGPYAPYIQSERLAMYKKYAKELVEKDHAYHCFCTSERLTKLREGQSKRGEAIMYDRACLALTKEEVATRLANGEENTIRLKVPRGKTIVKDLLRGYIQFDHAIIDDQILLKSDGYPTYHLANVVDDHDMKISHVIRGEEWLPSTPKHILLYKALGFDVPVFAHLGLLLNTDRSKLSKRQGDVAVEDFQKKGFLPSGLVNFVALLGWHPLPIDGKNQEIFQLQELEQNFSMDQVNKSGSIVNMERLEWINSRHIRELFTESAESNGSQRDDILGQGLPFIVSSLYKIPLDQKELNQELEKLLQTFGQAYIWRAMDLMKERVSAWPEFGPLCYSFFTDPDYSSPEATTMHSKYFTESTDEIVEEVYSTLMELSQDSYQSDVILKCIKDVAKRRKVGLKAVLMPIRYYLTGIEVGASLGDTIELLGKETTLKRLAKCIEPAST